MHFLQNILLIVVITVAAKKTYARWGFLHQFKDFTVRNFVWARNKKKQEATNEVICVGFPDVRGPVLQPGSCKTQHIAWTLDLDGGAPNTVTRQPC